MTKYSGEKALSGKPIDCGESDSKGQEKVCLVAGIYMKRGLSGAPAKN
jgi:hypothetical protein